MNPTAKRLIDANELRGKACSAMLEIANTPLPNEYSSKLALKMGEMFQKLIDDAPTLKVEPMRRGEWEMGRNRTKKSYLRNCSACGKQCYFCGTGCSYNYCPNCGAKMRGDEDATD